jgi:uncharacterized protein (TIGR02118 family)
MVKLVALYRKPEDVNAFEEHYANTHLPLIEQVPNVVKTSLTRFWGVAGGTEAPYYLMYEMYFEDKDKLDEAMKSPENRAAGRDLMSFARDIVTVMFADVYES